MAAHIAQLDPLQIPPDPFVGIEFRRITAQLFEMEPGSCTTPQKVLDRLKDFGLQQLYPHWMLLDPRAIMGAEIGGPTAREIGID
jgi:hypothetical protein